MDDFKKHDDWIKTYSYEGLPDSFTYEQMVTHEDADAIVIEVVYDDIDENGNVSEWYSKSWWAVKRDPYNISFKYLLPDGTINEGRDGTMYRLYNKNSGEHFYTSGLNEANNLKSSGWDYEGYAWVAPTTGNPVHRLYNPNAGDHHYTVGTLEKNNLIEAGWDY